MTDSVSHRDGGAAEYPEGAAVSRDWDCVGCGYNLRTLPMAGRCPECGLAVAESVAVLRAVPAAQRAVRLAGLSWLVFLPSGCVGLCHPLSWGIFLVAAFRLRYRCRLCEEVGMHARLRWLWWTAIAGAMGSLLVALAGVGEGASPAGPLIPQVGGSSSWSSFGSSSLTRTRLKWLRAAGLAMLMIGQVATVCYLLTASTLALRIKRCRLGKQFKWMLRQYVVGVAGIAAALAGHAVLNFLTRRWPGSIAADETWHSVLNDGAAISVVVVLATQVVMILASGWLSTALRKIPTEWPDVVSVPTEN